MPELGEIYIKVNARLDELERKVQGIEKTLPGKLGKVAEQAGKEFTKKIGEAASKAGNALTVGLTAPLLFAGKNAFDAAMKMETLESSMKILTGSSAKASKELSDLREMSKRVGGDFYSLATASRGLIAGFKGNTKETNYVLENFTKLSTIIGISKPDFERLAINLTQIGGSARLTGDELRETSAILPNLRTLMDKAFGTSRSEDLAKMGITGRQALLKISDAIEKSGMKVNLETMRARLGDFDNQLFELKVTAGKTLLPIANEFLQKSLIPALKATKEWFGKLTDEQKSGLVKWAAFAVAIGPAIKALTLVGSGIKGIIALRASFVASQLAMSASMGASAASATILGGALYRVGFLAGGAIARLGALATTILSSPMALAMTTAGAWYVGLAGAQTGGAFGPTAERHGPSDMSIGVQSRQLEAIEKKKGMAAAIEAYRRMGGKEDGSLGNIGSSVYTRDFHTRAKAYLEKADLDGATKGYEWQKELGGLLKLLNATTAGIGGKKAGTGHIDTTYLTSALIESMGRSIASPGGSAPAACAKFASQLIAKFTDGITDKGKGIEENAAKLWHRVVDMGGKIVTADKALPGAIAYRESKLAPSGYHVGINLGDGRVMDMNGQRDGRRNSKGFDKASNGWKFVNIPKRYLQKGMASGEINDEFIEAYQEMQTAIDEANRRLQESMEPIIKFRNARAAEKLKKSGGFLMDVISVREFGKNFLDLTDEANKNRVRGMAMQESHDALEAEKDTKGKEFIQKWVDNINGMNERSKKIAENKESVKDYVNQLEKQLEKEKELSNVAIALQEIRRRGLKVTGEEFDKIMDLAQAKDNLINKEKEEKALADLKEKRQRAIDRGGDAYRKYLREMVRSSAELNGIEAVRKIRIQDLASQIIFKDGMTGGGLGGFLGGLNKAMIDASSLIDKEDKMRKVKEWKDFGQSLAQSLVDPIKQAMVDFVKFDMKDFVGSIDNILSSAMNSIANKIINDALLGPNGLGGWFNKIAGSIIGGAISGGGGNSGGGGGGGFDGAGSGGAGQGGVTSRLSSASNNMTRPTFVQTINISVAGQVDNRTATQIGVEIGRHAQAALASVT